jgi:hypothetical protein
MSGTIFQLCYVNGLCTTPCSGTLCHRNSDYDGLCEVVGARASSDPMSIRDIYALMQNTEQRMNARKADLGSDIHSAHYASKTGGRGGGSFQPAYQQTYQQQPKPNY